MATSASAYICGGREGQQVRENQMLTNTLANTSSFLQHLHLQSLLQFQALSCGALMSCVRYRECHFPCPSQISTCSLQISTCPSQISSCPSHTLHTPHTSFHPSRYLSLSPLLPSLPPSEDFFPPTSSLPPFRDFFPPSLPLLPTRSPTKHSPNKGLCNPWPLVMSRAPITAGRANLQPDQTYGRTYTLQLSVGHCLQEKRISTSIFMGDTQRDEPTVACVCAGNYV